MENDNNNLNNNIDENQFNSNQPVPNATAVLVLGIVSIVGCFCYGVVGIICAIIALVLAGTGKKAFLSSPQSYSAASYKNLNAGRTCAIIGLSLSILYIVIVAIAISSGIYAEKFGEMPW